MGKDEFDLEGFFEAAKAQDNTCPSVDLIARVLADAGTIGVVAPVVSQAARESWLSRLLSPIGGWGGAVVLGSCAAFGLFAGLGDSDTLYQVPGMETVIAAFSGAEITEDYPFETFDLLTSEI